MRGAAVEQFAERVHGVVGRDLQNELVLVGTGRREQVCGRVELVQVSEMEPDVAARDTALQLGGCSFSDDPAAVEHRDLVGQMVGLVEVLGGEQDRDPGRGEFTNDLPHGATAARVQARGGLVEEDHPRLIHEGHREVEASSHPA